MLFCFGESKAVERQEWKWITHVKGNSANPEGHCLWCWGEVGRFGLYFEGSLHRNWYGQEAGKILGRRGRLPTKAPPLSLKSGSLKETYPCFPAQMLLFWPSTLRPSCAHINPTLAGRETSDCHGEKKQLSIGNYRQSELNFRQHFRMEPGPRRPGFRERSPPSHTIAFPAPLPLTAISTA